MKPLRTTYLALMSVLIAILFAACAQQPAPQASPPLPTEFPNEDKGLISPEGQVIIDAVLDGRIEAPKLITEPLEILPDNALTSQGTVPSAVQDPFWASISDFWKAKLSRTPSYADWETNYCSFSPDSGPSFNFKKSCARHDYGYGNWRKYGAFTSSAKLSIDNRFLKDMKSYCKATYSWWDPRRHTCIGVAYTYYGAVRKLG